MDEPRSVFAAFTRGTHALGITLIGLGALAALVPAVAGAPVVIVVGSLVALAGAVLAVFGWRTWSGGKGPLGFLAGGLAAACGLALVFNPMSTLDTVSSLVAAYMIVAGASALLFSSRLDDEGGRTVPGQTGLLGSFRAVSGFAPSLVSFSEVAECRSLQHLSSPPLDCPHRVRISPLRFARAIRAALIHERRPERATASAVPSLRLTARCSRARAGCHTAGSTRPLASQLSR